jgi:phosphate acetyltransferase
MDGTHHDGVAATGLDAGSLSLDTIFRDHRRYDDLVRRCQGKAPVPTAVVFPIEETALRGAVETAQVGITRPILVGPAALMRSAADAAGLDLSGLELVEAADEASSAATGVGLVHDGSARMLMKGSLHTAALLHAVLAHDGGLRGSRRLSHVFAFDIPAYPKPLLVTDAVVNISPTLADKVDICQNAIDLAQRLGIERPKVAILSAIETVDPAIPSTIDAAALCKMADRGQITGGLLDGPLAMDDAISPAAATTKHIESPVAGDADVLVVPDVEAGNILYKDLTYLSGADAAGVVLGATAPIVLTSRADTVRTRIASAALGALLTRASRS